MVDAVNTENPGTGTTWLWWRRNRWWLAALCVVAPVAFGTVYAKSARDLDAARIVETPSVAAGSTVDHSGRTIGPAIATQGTDSGAPARTRVVHVTVPISSSAADSTGVECTNIELREQTGAHRSWGEASSKLADVDPFTSRTICDPTTTEAYQLDLSFLVPDDAEGPFVVRFETGIDPVVALQFQVQP